MVVIPIISTPSHYGSITTFFLLLSSLIFAPLASSQTVVLTNVVTVAAPIPSKAPSFVDHDTFISAILNSTNVHRAAYNASEVRWNSTLADFASSYLTSHSNGRRDDDDEAETCTMKHSGGPYGENLALGCSEAGPCVDLWAGEASLYNYDDPVFGEDTGHFTQLVWRNTTDVGCGAKLCPGNGGWYLACEYWPRGNVIGAFAEEVSRPVGGGEASMAEREFEPGKSAAVAVAAMVVWAALLWSYSRDLH
ncbi:PR-1-like protein [Hypomontagnella submonticulosa]|nr:PR-1-like protein [Hypomontagnella submonticulosa]